MPLVEKQVVTRAALPVEPRAVKQAALPAERRVVLLVERQVLLALLQPR